MKGIPHDNDHGSPIGNNRPLSRPRAPSQRTRVRTALLLCGIVSALLYVGINFLGARQFPGYNLMSQTFSELIAVDAPSARLIVPLAVLYGVLQIAFAVGVWQSAVLRRALRFAAIGIAGKEAFGIVVTLSFPMHLREVLAAGGATSSDSWHLILTFVGVLFMLLGMVSGAAAFEARFRIYTIATILVFVIGGILTSGDAPRVAANLPTPWAGVEERINSYGYLLWIFVLAVMLLRRSTRAEEVVP
jgi:Protein of unknown function (DUF998)